MGSLKDLPRVSEEKGGGGEGKTEAEHPGRTRFPTGIRCVLIVWNQDWRLGGIVLHVSGRATGARNEGEPETATLGQKRGDFFFFWFNFNLYLFFVSFTPTIFSTKT